MPVLRVSFPRSAAASRVVVARSLPATLILVVTLSGATSPPDDTEPMAMALLSYADPSYLNRLREVAGPNGWGLTYAWDAYDDGSVNPESTAYAITTALALQAFLDAGDIGPAERAIAERWSRCCFSGGFYWYSDQPADAIFTPNVSAMMAGVMYRLGHTEQADEAITRLVQSWPWRYSERTDKPNDLLHEAYTYWGIEVYRQAGGTVQVPWTPRQAVERMDRITIDTDWPLAGVAVRNAYARCFAAMPPLPLPDPANRRDAGHLFWNCP
jgi:hypothetical protein